MYYLHIDKTLKTPIHRQLSACIESAILNGTLKKGELLPSEDQIGRTFSVSRTVVRRAFLELSRFGLIDQRQGQGHFVKQVQGYPDLLVDPHSYTQTKNESIKSSFILKEIISSQDELPLMIGSFNTDKLLRLKRIHTSSQELIFIDEWMIILEGSKSLEDEKLILSLLDDHRLIKESILEIQGITIEDSLLLSQSKNSLIYLISQDFHDENGRLIAHYKAIIPSSKTQLSVKVTAL
ncbi:MAG: GntR family transcriptional regulator [Erysipelotrichaceae bacterium]|nr:GntR family transcriptional regulator [Erysipelotrichaceae bacterium]